MIRKIGFVRSSLRPTFIANPRGIAVPIVTANDLGVVVDQITAKLDEVIDELNELKKENSDGRRDIREDEDQNKMLC